jgi:hypothetical protein
MIQGRGKRHSKSLQIPPMIVIITRNQYNITKLSDKGKLVIFLHSLQLILLNHKKDVFRFSSFHLLQFGHSIRVVIVFY